MIVREELAEALAAVPSIDNGPLSTWVERYSLKQADAILPLIAEHDAEVAAKALREAAAAMYDAYLPNRSYDRGRLYSDAVEWLNNRADRIEASHE